MRGKSIAVFVPVGLLLAAGIVLGPWGSVGTNDTRVAATPLETTSSDPVLEVYPTPGDQVPTLAARLEKEYAAHPNVRIVPDARRAQVIVLAPRSVHLEIAASLGAKSRSVTPDKAARATPVAEAPAVPAGLRQEFRLTRTTAEQFEAALLSTVGNRLTPVAGGGNAASAYRLTLTSGQKLGIAVNRQTQAVQLEGTAAAVNSASQLVQALDSPGGATDAGLRLVSLKAAHAADVRPAVEAFAMQQPPHGPVGPRTGAGSVPPRPVDPKASSPAPNAPLPPGAQGAADADQEGGLIGPVQVEMLEGLDVLVLRGNPRDVDKVAQIIDQIEQLSTQTKPSIEVVPLANVDCTALASLLMQLYDQVFMARQGSVSITALVKPNALLVVGRPENVTTVIELVKRLDQPVPPSAQFQVFRLKNAAAETAQTTVDTFLAQASQDGLTGLGLRGQVFADFRTNSLIVRASPRDLVEVAALIARIDAPANEACNEVRVFKLKNSLASELGPILQDAITGQMYGQRAQRGPGASVAGGASGRRDDYERKSVRLRLVTIDARGRGILNSGILTDAQVTADSRTNSVVVTASAESMPLIEALIRELDQLPSVEAQVKVFNLVNGDATNMVTMLQSIFSTQTGQETPAVRNGTAEGESTLVTPRFAVDLRTNSIIASGSAGQLTVVEAILMRLDESDVRNRESTVYRLKNAPATDVANAINQYLRSERQVQQMAPGLVSAFEQIEREVVVVPEPVSNSLIVSATPRFFEEITKLVKQLDERPPMVMIQVLIADVTLNDTDEFGVELGLQDSLLFDRSVPGLGTLDGTNIPGYLFNSTSPLGNSAAGSNPSLVGGQGLSNLGVGRANSELGFGGLVLSASSESVSVLLRALKECRRVDVLSRPQIMTMDNQTAEIMVGQDVPTITSSNITDAGNQINSITYREVGLIVTVTPRISPDKLVVMEIDAQNSEVGAEADGIPVSVNEGQVIRSPRINMTAARTVVSASNGQTVVLGGLISKSNTQVHRKVPWLGDVPLLGRLFRYDGFKERKAELLIIMTPHIVLNDEDAERIKQIESARMDWCLGDVMEMHDARGLTSRQAMGPHGAGAIYPDAQPAIDGSFEPVPMPAPEAQPTPAPGAVPPPAGPAPAPILEEPGVQSAPPRSGAIYRPARPAGQTQAMTTEGPGEAEVASRPTIVRLRGTGSNQRSDERGYTQ
jgi:type II secretion system protein D